MTEQSLSAAAALASRIVNHTGCHIFLTGKAGTGKTTFLRYITKYTHKKAVIAAPTGIAAINAGGVTLHSLFQLPFGCFIPQNQTQAHPSLRFSDPFSLIRNQQMNESRRKLLREMELLIIDEVSMLRADLLDAIDTVLRHVRRIPSVPFGGVQVLFIGDLLQLPPVIKEDEWSVLKTYYGSPFFFDALALQKSKLMYVELDKIYRQKDQDFVDLLNHLRSNTVTQADIELLNRHYQPGFKPSPSEAYITLTTHNYRADNINRQALDALDSPSFFFEATVTGEFGESSYPVDARLELKTGAQVMFVKNDPTGAQRFFNGKIATVHSLEKNRIQVKFNDSGKIIGVDAYEWQNLKYTLSETTSEVEETVAGTFSQYPLRLAWAITVHKSQGLTFDKAVIDIGNAFAPGQVYVALSRLTSLKGLVLLSPVNTGSLHMDGQVKRFSDNRENTPQLEAQVETESVTFLKTYLLQRFDFSGLLSQLKYHVSSYDEQKDEKKSAKQKYAPRARQVLEAIEQTAVNAAKFRQQIAQILDEKKDDYLVLLQQRIDAARNYFSPLLWEQSTALIKLMEEVKKEKKIKTYLKEILQAETAIYAQVNSMDKAMAMAEAVTRNREFTAESITESGESIRRRSLLEQALTLAVTGTHDDEDAEENKREKKARKTKKSPKEKPAAQPKPDTKAESLRLFRSGMNIGQIATERKLTTGTIETHLAYYITRGELDIFHFMNEDQYQRIAEVLKKEGSFELGLIKGKFGDEFTYGEIKLAMAAYLSKQD